MVENCNVIHEKPLVLSPLLTANTTNIVHQYFGHPNCSCHWEF